MSNDDKANEKTSVSAGKKAVSPARTPTGENGLVQKEDFSNTDEESLLKLMHECDFASSNAESFIEKLQIELVHLDTVS